MRAYLAKPVDEKLLFELLMLARQAPSGANLQPGTFTLVQGNARARLSSELVECWRERRQEAEDYDYFPRPMPMTLKRRQMASAKALYGALGIAREDPSGRAAQFERNFRFFDAPAALIVTIDSRFGSGGYMDLGMAIYGLMMAAQSRGLATCAIGTMASYPSVIRRHLTLDEHSNIVCGMAMGYADPDAAVNRTRTSRCELDEFVRVVS